LAATTSKAAFQTSHLLATMVEAPLSTTLAALRIQISFTSSRLLSLRMSILRLWRPSRRANLGVTPIFPSARMSQMISRVEEEGQARLDRLLERCLLLVMERRSCLVEDIHGSRGCGMD